MKRETKRTKQQETEAVTTVAVAIDPTFRDAMISVLIVSMTVNLFFLIAWITLQVTTVYDTEVTTLLFSR